MKEVHGSSQLLSCEECGKIYSRKDKLNDHVKRVHAEEKPASFSCDQCKKYFTRKDSLQRHIRDSHKREQNYECPECPQRFSRIEHMKSHQEAGKHSVLLSCKYCCQDLTFKSSEAAQRHFIERRYDTTCRNVKYAIGEMPTEEQREEFNKRENHERMQEELEKKAKFHYRECYTLSCKCEAHPFASGAKNDNLEEFEARFVREEKAKMEKWRLYWEKREPYDADEFLLDPISKNPIHDPVRYKECGHTCDRNAFLEMKKTDDYNFKKGYISKKGYVCRVKDCNSRVMSVDDLEPDSDMAAEIEKRREKKRKEKEEKRKREAKFDAEIWEWKKRNREKMEEKKRQKKSKMKKSK